MADPNTIRIRIQFKQHLKQRYSKAHVHLNNYFSHSLPNPAALRDEENAFRHNFVDIIRNQSIDVITEDICAATGTPPDEVHMALKQRLDRSILTWHHGMDNTPLRKVTDIEYAYDTAIDKQVTCIHIHINIDHLGFQHEFTPTDLTAWGTDPTIDDVPVTPSTQSAPTSANNALTPEFQKLIIDLAKSPQQPHQSSSSALPPISTQQLFNVTALPPDVRVRYDKHATGQLIKGNDMGPFMTKVPMLSQPSQTRQQQYHLDPPGIGHRLITRDGTVFYLRDQGAKTNQMFVSSAPTCKGNTPEHIRAWYMAFTTFAASKGKYVHPYFCFRSDHVASHRGFSIGDDDDYTQHDLPSRYVPTIES